MTDSHKVKLAAAIAYLDSRRAREYLGTRWILHPANPQRPTKGTYNRFGMRMP